MPFVTHKSRLAKITALAIWLTMICSGAESITYTYDLLNRLVRVEYENGTVIEYAYDAAGNRVTQEITVPNRPILTLNKTGDGSGVVSSDPPGIACGDTCEASFEVGTTVALTAVPDPGSVFSGWQGASCSENAQVLDQSQLTGADQNQFIHSARSVYQTFTGGVSGLLTGLEVSVYDSGSSGDLLVEILDMSGGDIGTAPVLGSRTLSENDLGPSPLNLEAGSVTATLIDFTDQQISISSGGLYTFRLSTPRVLPSGYGLRISLTDQYSGGDYECCGDDPQGSGLDAAFKVFVSAGCLIEVNSDVTVTATFATEGPVDDHGNTLGTATAVSLDSSTGGVLEGGGDVDVFQIVLPDAGFLSVETSGSIDTFGTLIDASGTTIATDDDSGPGLNFRIPQLVSEGTYFISVRGFNASSTGNYTLVVSFSHTPPVDDHGDTNGTATAVSLASPVEGELEVGGDLDVFQIVLPTSGFLIVETSGTTDTFGALRDVRGGTISTDDDSGSGLNFRINRSLSGGTYFVEVRGFNSSVSGNYTFLAMFTAGDLIETVSANPQWTETRVTVNAGDTLSITATGSWSIDTCCTPLFGPEGLRTANENGFITTHKGALIAAIAPPEQDDDYFKGLGQNDPAFFVVGANLPPFTAITAGKLYLGFNDWGLPGNPAASNDNTGAMTATITTPDPPTAVQEITANPQWTETSIALAPGDRFSVAATGAWSIDSCCTPQFGPDGLGTDNGSGFLTTDKGALIAAIAPPGLGDDYFKGLGQNHADFFVVGSNLSLHTATRSGILYFGFNDWGLPGNLPASGDNTGSVTASITTGVAVGDSQIVSGAASVIRVPAGGNVSAEVRYTTSDNNASLAGLGLRLHFDSMKLDFVNLTDVLATNFVAQGAVEDDTDNFDNDVSTDKFILIAWSDINGAWPGTALPITLFDAHFTTRAELPIGATSTMRFSSASTATGYGFESTPIIIEVVPGLLLDVDGDGTADALTDGLLVLRHLFGFHGSALTDDAVAPACGRCTAEQIGAAIGSPDADGNGAADALTDGLLILRYLFGFRGSALIDAAVSPGCTRCTAEEIEDFLSAAGP